MSWTYVNSAYGELASGTQVDASSTLNIQSGDLLVAVASWRGGDSSITSVGPTSGVDLLSMQAHGATSGNRSDGSIGYVVVGTANSSATIRMILGSTMTSLAIAVLQFRPDSGDTVSLVAGPSLAVHNAYDTTTMQSGNISPNGSDLAVVAMCIDGSGDGVSSEQIGGSAATGYRRTARSTIFYRLYTSSQSSIYGRATSGSADQWVADILAFESASSGSSSVPVIMHHRRMMEAI